MNDRFSADDLPRSTDSAQPRSPWPIDLAHLRPFRLGAIEVRPASREVLYGTRREVLEPKVMKVLVALGSARGEILSRGDLIDCCWDGLAVSDDAIDRVVARLRALSRTFGGFKVETIVKVGYRLVEGEAAERSSGRSTARGSIDRRLLIAGGGAAVLGAAGGLWLLSRPAAEHANPEVERLLSEAGEMFRLGRPDDMAAAAALYRQALDRDPDNALAWGRLALVHRFQSEFGSPDEAPAMQARTRSAAARALELDPDSGEAAAALAMLTPIYGNWARAEMEMRRVLARHPGPVRVRLARLLSDTGRLGEALQLVRQVVAADPQVPRTWNFLGRLLWDNGRLEEAEKVIQSGLARWPRHVLLWFTWFFFLAYTGRPKMALAFAGDIGNRPIGIPDRRFELAMAKARALGTGAGADIDDAVARTFAALPEGVVYAMDAVTFFATVGHLDHAFEVADAYFFGRGPAISDIRLPQTGTYAASHGRECEFLFSAPAAALRADRRFAALTREIGLEAYWRKTGTLPDYRRRA